MRSWMNFLLYLDRMSEASATTAQMLKTFHNMRTIFNHEVKKVESSQGSGVGTDAVYVPCWVHFSQMQVPGPSQDNMEHNPVLETSLEEEGKQDHGDTSANSGPSTSVSSLTTLEAPTPNKGKEEQIITKMEIYSSILSCLQQPTVVDPTDIFGKYIAETLKGMRFWNRELCKAEIQQVILKHLFNDLGNE